MGPKRKETQHNTMRVEIHNFPSFRRTETTDLKYRSWRLETYLVIFFNKKVEIIIIIIWLVYVHPPNNFILVGSVN